MKNPRLDVMNWGGGGMKEIGELFGRGCQVQVGEPNSEGMEAGRPQKKHEVEAKIRDFNLRTGTLLLAVYLWVQLFVQRG